MNPHKLFIIDDHKVVRDGIKAMLIPRMDIKIIGDAANGEEALRLIAHLRPDIAFIDLKLPDANGAELIGEIKKIIPEINCALLTADPNPTDLKVAQNNGCDAFMTKDMESSEYFAALDKLITGKKYISPAFSEIMLQTPTNYTDRELEVLKEFANGLSYKEIGAKLDMSPRTVETHKNNLLRKMDVKSIVEMVRIAIREGVIEP